MKYFILTCTVLVLSLQCSAQWPAQPVRPKQTIQKKKKKAEPVHYKHAAFVELLGPGGLSLNYQRNHYLSTRWNMATRFIINPFVFTSYPLPNGSSKRKFSPYTAVLFESIYKVRKGEFTFGLGMSGQLTYDYSFTPTNDVVGTTRIRKTAIGEFGYSQMCGKHMYTGLYAYVFMNEIQVWGLPGFKIGYKFGKREEDY